jgi:pyruvate,water dikinase
VGEAIRGGYRALGGGAGSAPGEVPVAVRSSATAEDSAEASFAGVQDTYLWVRGEDQVLDQVRRCWASLYDVESLTYRLQRGLGETGLAMGVVIQQMVDAHASGVVFTRSPVTGDRSVIVLEASWGLGSAVVSGEVTPDRYTVNKVTGEVITNAVSTKTRRHRPDPAGGGVRAEAVPAALQDRPCLAEAEVARLVEVARRVEAHYGTPQDIEWAIAADPAGGSRVLVLQSRPETVWSGRPERPLAKPRGRPFDHVVSLLGGQVDPPGDDRP